MASSRFKSNFRFALRRESPEIRADIPLNQTEKVGNLLSWFAYDFKNSVRRTITDPRCLTVAFTLFFMTLTAWLFYASITWNLFIDGCDWIIENINWSYVRFALWVLSELTVFGLGIRAFGRFSNRDLMKHYGVNT